MLPKLEGSDKQITWAKSIREQMLKVWEMTEPDLFKTVEKDLKQATLAAWWITHRQKELGTVLPYIVKGATTGKAVAKPGGVKPAATPSPPVRSFSNDEVYRFVGKLRCVATGEIVDDPDCPF